MNKENPIITEIKEKMINGKGRKNFEKFAKDQEKNEKKYLKLWGDEGADAKYLKQLKKTNKDVARAIDSFFKTRDKFEADWEKKRVFDTKAVGSVMKTFEAALSKAESTINAIPKEACS